ncbi:hypothetical protein LINPERPRIM_LOCUS35640 [Linum perenne]
MATNCCIKGEEEGSVRGIHIRQKKVRITVGVVGERNICGVVEDVRGRVWHLESPTYCVSI